MNGLPVNAGPHPTQGIKVKDSESKKKVKEVLLAEQAMREMMVDAPSAAAAAPSEKMVVG